MLPGHAAARSGGRVIRHKLDAAGAVALILAPVGLAGAAAGPGRAAAKRPPTCIHAQRGGQTVTLCALTGPRGPRGPAGPRGGTGPAGPTGKTGAAGPAGPAGRRGATGRTGDTGATGPQGPAGAAGATGAAGSVRAYALVPPSATTPTLVAAQSANFQAIRRVAVGTYCLTRAPRSRPRRPPRWSARPVSAPPA